MPDALDHGRSITPQTSSTCSSAGNFPSYSIDQVDYVKDTMNTTITHNPHADKSFGVTGERLAEDSRTGWFA